VKKILAALLIFVFLSLCFSTTVSGVKVWPGKHYIKINRWYTSDEDVGNARIQIQNPDSKDITVTIRADAPGGKGVTEGYSPIPDLSWIKITPTEVHVPAKSNVFIEVSIEVPEDVQEEHFNEKWEAYVVVSEPSQAMGGNLNIKIELAVKLFITTPTGYPSGLRTEHMIAIIVISLVILIIAYYYSERKSKTAAQYYFKKKK